MISIRHSRAGGNLLKMLKCIHDLMGLQSLIARYEEFISGLIA